MSEFPRFTEGQNVLITNLPAYDAVAIEWVDGDDMEIEVDMPANPVFEVISYDYDGGFVYNLRLNGGVDEYDYIRVFGVSESDLTYF